MWKQLMVVLLVQGLAGCGGKATQDTEPTATDGEWGAPEQIDFDSPPQEIWSLGLGGRCTTADVTVTPSGKLVLPCSGSTLLALDYNTGETVWERELALSGRSFCDRVVSHPSGVIAVLTASGLVVVDDEGVTQGTAALPEYTGLDCPGIAATSNGFAFTFPDGGDSLLHRADLKGTLLGEPTLLTADFVAEALVAHEDDSLTLGGRLEPEFHNWIHHVEHFDSTGRVWEASDDGESTRDFIVALAPLMGGGTITAGGTGTPNHATFYRYDGAGALIWQVEFEDEFNPTGMIATGAGDTISAGQEYQQGALVRGVSRNGAPMWQLEMAEVISGRVALAWGFDGEFVLLATTGEIQDTVRDTLYRFAF